MVCHHVILYGLPDTSIREAKERVRTAIKNSGYELRSRKVLINLAPANIRKAYYTALFRERYNSYKSLALSGI